MFPAMNAKAVPFLSTPTPLSRYRNDLKREGFYPDSAQEAAACRTQRLYDDLLSVRAQQPRARRRFFSRKTLATAHVPGLYLWGEVGRGKTYLVLARNCGSISIDLCKAFIETSMPWEMKLIL